MQPRPRIARSFISFQMGLFILSNLIAVKLFYDRMPIALDAYFFKKVEILDVLPTSILSQVLSAREIILMI